MHVLRACFSAALVVAASGAVGTTSGCAKGEKLDGDGGAEAGGGGAGAGPGSTGTESTGSSCEEQPCKLTLPQCGCPDGEKCGLGGAERACLPAGTVGWGDPCTEDASCEPGTMCVGYTPTTRSCSKFCTTDADCEAPGGLCAIDITDGSGNEIPNATLCSQDCDLITSDGCNATGTSCQFAVRAMMDPYTLCAPSGAGVDDAPCSTNADCASGFVCLTNAQMVSQCYQWCNTAAPACPMAQVCQGLEIQPGVPLLIGDIHYGACT